MKNISNLLSKIEHYEVRGDPEATVEGVKFSSSNVNTGDAFFCLRGLSSDGHLYAKEAVKNGASLLFVDRWLDGELKDITQIKVKDTKYVMGIVSAEFYNWPSNKLKLVAITGTNGKSTTAELLKSIASSSGESAGLIGTLGMFIDDKKYKSNNTTPESADIQAMLARMCENGVKFCVMEVSSHAVDRSRVVGCKFDAIVFTNLSQDHLDYHGTMDNYFKTKLELFKAEEYSKVNCRYIINGDDAWGIKILYDNRSNPDYVSFGLDNEPKFKGEMNETSISGSSFNVSYNSKHKVEIEVNLPGIFNAYNALAAAATAVTLKYKEEEIKNGISRIKNVYGRCERISSEKGFSVIVDYAHTPDGLRNLLSSLKNISEGRIIVVFGCGGDRDRTKRPLMGRIGVEYSDFAFITSDNPRSEDSYKIIDEIVDGMSDDSRMKVVEDRKSAIYSAIKMAKHGDIVVLAGKGHENYQEISGVRHHFDDKEIAWEALRKV